MRTVADYAFARSELDRDPGKSRLGLPPPHPGVASREIAISLLVSLAEDFSFGLLVDRTTPFLEPGKPLAHLLWDDVLGRIGSKWDTRLKAWKQFHSVRVKEDWRDKYEVLDGFVTARNSIAHGLGRLTWQQKRNEEILRSTRRRLDRAGIDVAPGDRLRLEDAHVTRCAGVVREFVFWLDAQPSIVPDPGTSL